VVPPAPDFDFSTVVDTTHAAHSVPELHQAGHGLSLAGHAGLGALLPPAVRGTITAIDVWEHYAVVAGSQGGLGFAIVDVADPKAPKVVGWHESYESGMTVRFSKDGQYVFYGCQDMGVAQPPYFVQGTCADPKAVSPEPMGAGGVVVVDVRDKTSPKFVDFLPGVGAHNLYVATIGGEDVIATETTDILVFHRDTGKLEKVAEVPGNHDATIQRHPVTGDWLLFTGTGELAIYNVTDPRDPQIVYEASYGVDYRGWHEQTLIPGVVDGRVVLAVAGESIAGEGLKHSVTFLDVTDPRSPAVLGTWAPPLPAIAPWFQYRYSIHEMAATPTGQVAVAWYHAGVWVVDVSTKERQAEPVTLAAYQPHEAIDVTPATGVQTPVPDVPTVWGAGWDKRGYLLVPDAHTGVYVLEPDWGLHPAVSGGQ
jgi:hypothetical protein